MIGLVKCDMLSQACNTCEKIRSLTNCNVSVSMFAFLNDRRFELQKYTIHGDAGGNVGGLGVRRGVLSVGAHDKFTYKPIGK